MNQRSKEAAVIIGLGLTALLCTAAMSQETKSEESESVLGLVGLFSKPARGYVIDRLGETRLGGTTSFDGTLGAATYLPLRWLPNKLFEVGLGYHHQEGGDGDPFFIAGTDLKRLYRKTLKPILKLEGPPLPDVYLHVWANFYRGQEPWVVGKETGISATVELASFGGKE